VPIECQLFIFSSPVTEIMQEQLSPVIA
jgi:hypothetical protein